MKNHRRTYKVVVTAVLAAIVMAVPCLSRSAGMQEGKRLFREHRYAEALKVGASELERIGEPSTRKDSVRLLNATDLCGDIYNALGVHDRALGYYRDALRLSRAMSLDSLTAATCNSIYSILYYQRQYESGEELLAEAEAIYRRLGEKLHHKRILNNFGLLRAAQGKPLEALEYFRRALDADPSDAQTDAGILVNMATVYSVQSQWSKAEKALSRAMVLTRSHPNTQTSIQATLNMADLKLLKGDFTSVRGLIRSVCNRMGHLQLVYLPDTWAHITDLQLQMGDSVAALRSILEYESVRDSVAAQSNEHQLQQLLVMYDTERLQRNNELLALQVSRRNLLVVMVLMVVVALVAGLLLLRYRYRMNRRKNELIARQREQLLEYERREHERTQRQMSEELDRKNRELTSFAMDHAAINEFHSRLASDLESARKSLQGNRPEDVSEVQTHQAVGQLQEATRELKHFSDQSISEDFRVYFEQVHPSFFLRLRELHPVLTDKDRRLCAFLYLGMATKEIAAITHRSVRSVESSRLRLRKKMDLPAQEDLHRYLASIITD